MCLFSLQPGGFTIEISNNNSTMVMTGMRIQIGTQAIERAPSYIEIFGRTMQLIPPGSGSDGMTSEMGEHFSPGWS